MISRIVMSPIWYQGMPLQARLIEKDRAPRIADLPLLGFVCASLSTNLISIGVIIIIIIILIVVEGSYLFKT